MSEVTRYKIKHNTHKGDHIVLDAGGYECELNGEVVEAAEFDAVVAERDRIAATAIDLFGATCCERHMEQARGESFKEFYEKEIAGGCFRCALEKASALTAENTRLTQELEAAKDRVERMKNSLEWIAARRCGVYGHSVAVGCGCPEKAQCVLDDLNGLTQQF